MTAHAGKDKGYPCKRCGGKLLSIDGEFWDRDGIREASKCVECKTEYKSYASGYAEKTNWNEYSGEWPEHIKQAEAQSFHEKATRRGYVKAEGIE
jgi:hypothetical protein